MGIVYRAVSKTTGKCYVGLTTQTLAERRCGHRKKRKYFKNHFYRALRKYGWKDFAWMIVCESDNLDELRRREREFIIIYDSLQNGYNSTPGGECGFISKKRPGVLKNRVAPFCEHCGTEFDGSISLKTKRYCSSRCQVAAQTKRNWLKKSIASTCVCNYCGVEFRGHRKKYCSRKCYNSNHNDVRRDNRKKECATEVKRCSECASEYTTDRQRSVCCSAECYRVRANRKAKKWKKENSLKVKESKKRYCVENPPKIREQGIRYRSKHPGIDKKYRIENRDKVNEYERMRRTRDADKIAARKKAWKMKTSTNVTCAQTAPIRGAL